MRSNRISPEAGKFQRPTESTAHAFQKAYFTNLQEDTFDNVMHTNAVGPYWLSFAFLPLLEKWKEIGYTAVGGRKFAPQIIMTSSMNGWTKDPTTAGFSFPYMYSKSAIGHATSSLAHELLPLGIRVNGIAPGELLSPDYAHPLHLTSLRRIFPIRDVGPRVV